MVRSLHKTKILFAVAMIFTASACILPSAHADVTENVDFIVNIAETLTLTITDPTYWAEGQLINTNPTTGKHESNFLRNKVNVKAKTNNPVGVTVSMYTKGDTDLRNTTSYSSTDPTTYINTLSGTETGTTVANFPTNRWGYSINDTGSSTSANYYSLSTSPIQLFTTTSSTPGYDAAGVEQDQDVYFGAKADETMASGTYFRTVYFAAVTGTVDTSNPLKPTNPSSTDPINNAAHYDSTIGNTTYTRRSASGTGTDPVTGSMDSTSSDVTKGDISTTYAQAYGVTSESNGSALATAFAVSAGVAATSGIAFFVAAKRRKKDDGEEG